mmetsp:Transcript_34254/g.102600  ORF Transcript_34254/g.102600 Transcript_34254/m.102600 type:complete len:364 (-) Transcript_34254:636-1727(-)
MLVPSIVRPSSPLKVTLVVRQLTVPPRIQPRRQDDVVDGRKGSIHVHEKIPHDVLGGRIGRLSYAGAVPPAPIERHPIDQFADVIGFDQGPRAIVGGELRIGRDAFPFRTGLGGALREFVRDSIDHAEAAEGFDPVRLGVGAVLHPRPPRCLSVLVPQYRPVGFIPPRHSALLAVDERPLPASRRSESDGASSLHEITGDAPVGAVPPQLLPHVHGVFESVSDPRLERLLVEEQSLLYAPGLIGRCPRRIHQLGYPRVVESRSRPGIEAESEIVLDPVVVQIGAVVPSRERHQIVPRVREGQSVPLQQIDPHDRDEKIAVGHEKIDVGPSVLPVFAHRADLREDVLVFQQGVGRADAIVQRLQ